LALVLTLTLLVKSLCYLHFGHRYYLKDLHAMNLLCRKYQSLPLYKKLLLNTTGFTFPCAPAILGLHSFTTQQQLQLKYSRWHWNQFTIDIPVVTIP